MKQRDYICVTKKKGEKGRYTVVFSDIWYWSVSRSSVIRLVRLMNKIELRKVEKFTSSGISKDRWIYWWF